MDTLAYLFEKKIFSNLLELMKQPDTFFFIVKIFYGLRKSKEWNDFYIRFISESFEQILSEKSYLSKIC